MTFDLLINNIQQTHEFFQARASKQIDQNLTLRNWLIGFYLVEFEQKGQDRAEYGSKLLKKTSQKLSSKGIQGVSDRSLRIYRQFFLTYPQIWQTVSAKFNNTAISGLLPMMQIPPAQTNEVTAYSPEKLLSNLTFSHFVELIQVDSELKRRFYEVQVVKNSWSVRVLERAINSLLFERTGLSTDKKAVIKSHASDNPETAQDLFRNPYLLEFLGLHEQKYFTENQLETAIINHLQDFLIEMGRGFCFEARQKRITFDNEHYHIDLVFYHRILRCHILIDLKVGKFSHADAGQMNFYLNYYKDNEQTEYDNPPIGLILCASKNDTFVEYTLGGLDNEIWVSKYLVALPSIDELKRLVEAEMRS